MRTSSATPVRTVTTSRVSDSVHKIAQLINDIRGLQIDFMPPLSSDVLMNNPLEDKPYLLTITRVPKEAKISIQFSRQDEKPLKDFEIQAAQRYLFFVEIPHPDHENNEGLRTKMYPFILSRSGTALNINISLKNLLSSLSPDLINVHDSEYDINLFVVDKEHEAVRQN